MMQAGTGSSATKATNLRKTIGSHNRGDMLLASFDKSRFFTAEQYIQASSNMIEGMLQTGNPFIIIANHKISSDELTDGLKFSSHNLILPALFCLYQGIELLLKGFVYIKSTKHSKHNAEDLCRRFSDHYPEEVELIKLFSVFLSSPKEFIEEYKQTNNIQTVAEFYNSLRYPEQKDGRLYDYDPLMRAGNERFLPQVVELYNDIEQLLSLSVR